MGWAWEEAWGWKAPGFLEGVPGFVCTQEMERDRELYREQAAITGGRGGQVRDAARDSQAPAPAGRALSSTHRPHRVPPGDRLREVAHLPGPASTAGSLPRLTRSQGPFFSRKLS